MLTGVEIGCHKGRGGRECSARVLPWHDGIPVEYHWQLQEV